MAKGSFAAPAVTGADSALVTRVDGHRPDTTWERAAVPMVDKPLRSDRACYFPPRSASADLEVSKFNLTAATASTSELRRFIELQCAKRQQDAASSRPRARTFLHFVHLAAPSCHKRCTQHAFVMCRVFTARLLSSSVVDSYFRLGIVLELLLMHRRSVGLVDGLAGNAHDDDQAFA